MVVAEVSRYRVLRSLRTVKRSHEQLLADDEIDNDDPEPRLRAILDDMHALAEEYAEIQEARHVSAEYCPLCGAEWSAMPLEFLICPICRSLHRRASEPPAEGER